MAACFCDGPYASKGVPVSNVEKFEELLRSDEELQAKIKEAFEAYEGDKDDAQAVHEAVIAPLAEEAGLPFTYEEASEYASKGVELTEEEADEMAGGTWCFIVGGGTDSGYCGIDEAGVDYCMGAGVIYYDY